MCHGHPRDHACGHLSINWYYCPSALIDLSTGYETPCSNVSFAPGQRSTLDCPLQNCGYKEKGGRWLCCVCNQGPNSKGWCVMPRRYFRPNRDTLVDEEVEGTCDHGCCEGCQKLGALPEVFQERRAILTGCTIAPSRSPSPELSFTELRKGAASRKSGYGPPPRAHRRSAYSIIGGFTTPERDGGDISTATPSSSSSGGSRPGYRIELDYRSKRTKAAKKSHKGRGR